MANSICEECTLTLCPSRRNNIVSCNTRQTGNPINHASAKYLEMLQERKQMQANLRKLAEGILEAHEVVCDYCPNNRKQMYEHCTEKDCCQCDLCQLSREIMGGGE